MLFFEFVIHGHDDLNFVGFQGIRQRRQAGQILEHGHGVLIKDVEAAGVIQNNAQQVPLPRHLQTQANFALPATQGGDAGIFVLTGQQFAKTLAIAFEQFTLRTGSDGRRCRTSHLGRRCNGGRTDCGRGGCRDRFRRRSGDRRRGGRRYFGRPGRVNHTRCQGALCAGRGLPGLLGNGCRRR